MGVQKPDSGIQRCTEQRIREAAAFLKEQRYAYRSNVGYQAGRLLAKVEGPDYGYPTDDFPKSTPYYPSSPERFEPRFQRGGPISS